MARSITKLLIPIGALLCSNSAYSIPYTCPPVDDKILRSAIMYQFGMQPNQRAARGQAIVDSAGNQLKSWVWDELREIEHDPDMGELDNWGVALAAPRTDQDPTLPKGTCKYTVTGGGPQRFERFRLDRFVVTIKHSLVTYKIAPTPPTMKKTTKETK